MPAEIRLITAADDPPWWAPRTQRSLPEAPAHGQWRVRAGSWLPRPLTDFIPPTPESPCFLIGCTLVDRASLPQKPWMDLLQSNSGLFRREDADSLPIIHSLWMNDAAAQACEDMADLNAMARHGLQQDWLVIRHAPLDVCYDPRPRLLQVITSLQRGGAERLVLDQHRALSLHGIGTSLLTLGSPCRQPFESPPDAIAMRLPPDPTVRATAIQKAIQYTGSDVTHAHLIDGETLANLEPSLPLMVTFHNQQLGWPEAIDKLNARTQTLLIGCSQVVSREIESSFPNHPVRTVWNGITQPPRLAHLRASHLRIVSLANPRPQKRLPFLMDVLAALPEAKLKIAGEASVIHADAQQEVRQCEERIARHGIGNVVEWLGAVEDVPALLAESDVLVSTSLHEGLSLAQLEALSAGVPVVTTEVGGAAEIAARHPGMVKLLPLEATPAAFAAAIREVAPYRGRDTLANDFTTPVMAARHAWLMQGLLVSNDLPKRGLLLITNNFSTGGAQSSARRLLLKLRDLGEHVRAVVLQEQPHHPTPGRAALEAEGVEVISLDPPEVCDAQTALIPLLHVVAESPPEAIVFWNVIPEYKVLLADALPSIPIFDVSPGEMFFASLDRYFAHPRPGLPYLDARAYGQRLAGVIVKHASEIEWAQGLLGRPVHLISNGVTQREFKVESDSAAWVLGSAARIHPHKRLEDLIESFRRVHAQFPQARLRLAGAPDAGQEEYAQLLQRETADLPIEWCGEIFDMATFHDSLSVFAMISEPSGCPNASLEAMASSLPIVATAVGGANQQIEHGVTGFLTPAREVIPFAEALIKLLGDSPLRLSMRQAAHERARTHFSLEQMAVQYRRVCLNR